MLRFGLAAATLVCLSTAFAQTPPTPESVLGKKPGDDFYLASYTESLGYFQKLAAATNKLRLINVGRTTRGLEWYAAVISSPANLDALDRHKDASRRLAWARDLTDEQARALSREARPIVHIDGGLHSTEVAHAQHTIQLAYDLVSRNDPETNAILDNVILLLWFSLNPDGQNMVVDWYRRNLGTPYEVSPMVELYQEYVGHDNNRDGYMNNMIESQVVTRTTLEFNPVVFYNHHQTAPFPARIWIPPFAEPVSSNVHPLVFRWVNVFGTRMAAYLDERNMPGAIHRGQGFDDWYPGFIDHVNSFRNTISFLTETALYRYATPHFYTVDDFPRDRQDLRSEVFYSSPWKGGWWRLGDAVRYMLGASMSVLDTAARNREALLYNRYQAGRDTIARFRREPPYAYAIPQDQRDPVSAAILVDKLRPNGIEIHQATQPFRVNGIECKPGCWVVLMDQPFAALVKELMEVQSYPDLRDFPGGPPDLPYDVAGWTLPMQMGVTHYPMTAPVPDSVRAALRRVDSIAPPAGAVTGTGSLFTLSLASNAAYPAINDLLAAGAKVAFVTGESDAVAVSGIDRARAESIAKARSVTLQAVPGAPAAYPALAKPRVGLFRPWSPSIDEGWTRWILENHGLPPISLYVGDIRAGKLRERVDVIIFPDMQDRSIMEGFRAGTVPPQYAGGIGEQGVDAIRDFVREGGTLVTFNNASLFAIDRLKLPVTNVVAGLKNDEFFCSGSLLRVEVKNAAHPVVRGLPAEPVIMFDRGPVFEPKTGFEGHVLASFPKERNPLMSGFLLHPERIQDKAAALDVAMGKGRVILLGFRPQWRGQSHGGYKFLFNSVLYSGELPKEFAASKPAASPAGRAVPVPVTAAAKTWKSLIGEIRSDLDKLSAQNKIFFAAKGPKAVEEKAKLDAAAAAFEKLRIPAIEDARLNAEDKSVGRKMGEIAALLRKMAAEVRTKDLTTAAIAGRDRLDTLDQEITTALSAQVQ